MEGCLGGNSCWDDEPAHLAHGSICRVRSSKFLSLVKNFNFFRKSFSTGDPSRPRTRTRRRRLAPASRLRRVVLSVVSEPVVEAWTDYGPQQVLRLSPAFTRAVTLCLFFAFLLSGDPVHAVSLTLSGDTVITGSLGASQLYSDGITGTGNLLKTGDSVLTLGGTSTFSGDITVNGGVVVVDGSSQLGDASNMVTVNGNSSTGFGGGMLLLDAGTSALAFNQSLSLDGRGATTNNSSSALLTLGNVTLNGTVQLGNSTNPSYLNSGIGNLTLAGPVNLGGSSYFAGNGNTIITGAVSGASSFYKAATSTLPSTLWLQNPNNSFTGALTLTGGYARVSNGGALGKSATPLSFYGGVLEVRTDADSAGSFVNTNVTGTPATQIFLDRSLRGRGLSETVVFGNSAPTYSTVVGGRNGYNFSLGKAGSTFGREWMSLTNNSNGLFTINQNLTVNNPTNGGRFDVSFSGPGDFVFAGSISSLAASPALLDGISKNAAGLAIFTGTSTTLRGPTNVNGGVLQISGFGALGNVGPQSGAINLNSGALNFSGTAGESTSKLINLSGTTANGILLANQVGSAPLTFNSGVAAGGIGSKRWCWEGQVVRQTRSLASSIKMAARPPSSNPTPALGSTLRRWR